MRSLYILDINPLSNIWFTNIFSHFSRLTFHCVMISFAAQKLFTVMWSHLFFVSCALGVKSRESSPRWCQGDHHLCARLGVLRFRFYVWVFNPFWVNFCVWCKTVVQLHTFVCDCPLFLAPFVKETVLSPFYIGGSSFGNSLTTCAWVYFWTFRLVLKGCCWTTKGRRDSWPPEENSIRGQRRGLIAQSFCVIKFY